MRSLHFHYICLVAFLLVCGCSQSSSQLDEERIRQNTFSQIPAIKNGETKTLQDPSPSLMDEIVSDAPCAKNIEAIDFCNIGPDLSDLRFRSLERLPYLKSIFFYCTQNTDEFLANVPGMASLEELETELADVSDAGMKHVAQSPNLRKLVLYGGSVGNAGLAELEGHEKLENLELVNTKVTDDGLTSLTKLPNLKSLVLYWEDWRGKKLTNAGLKHLNNLSQLQTLELAGGWVSEDAVKKLQSSLPECKISTESSY